MKFKLLLFVLLIFSTQMFSQSYPEVSIRDIQFIQPDSLKKAPYDYKSQFEGDTVIVTGVVMNAPYRYDDNTEETLHSGAPAVYLQDTSATEWSGVLLRDVTGSETFKALDTGYIIKVTVVVKEFFTTTQINVVSFSAENVLGISQRPQPVKLSLDSLAQTGTFNPVYEAEKWEGVLVEIENVISAEPNALGVSGSYRIFDGNNTNMIVGSSSDYFRSSQPAPLPGTLIAKIRGHIESRNNIQTGGWFIINPIYFPDVEFGTIIPPTITNLSRDKGIVKFGETVQVSATVKDADGTLNKVNLYYKVNGSESVIVEMNPIEGDSIWAGTIPAFDDSTLISYYIEAIDDIGAKSTNPIDTVKNVYFYHVLNRDIKIQDIQHSPFGSGFSGYNNFQVTVRGIVTADTSDIQGDGANIGPQVYIQDGTGPWSGIQIFGTEPLKLTRGNDVTVTGTVGESFGVTRIQGIDSPTQITINNTNAEVPEPTIISTSNIAQSSNGTVNAEQYEGVLVRYLNVKVIDDNADGNTGPDEGTGGNRNYGEIYVADRSNIQSRIETQDGTHSFHNFWDTSLESLPNRIVNNSTFESISGILFYSFSNYKLVPRSDDDFQGFVTDVEEISQLPEEFKLFQNYPNPFNPSTKIEFSVPFQNYVSLKVYDVLGREITSLISSELKAGKYSVTFDGSNLSSGIYFYRLDTGNNYSVKKMMLIK